MKKISMFTQKKTIDQSIFKCTIKKRMIDNDDDDHLIKSKSNGTQN